ncbi:MAG: hypothetical protein ABEH60_07505 [Halonotius sp.]
MTDTDQPPAVDPSTTTDPTSDQDEETLLDPELAEGRSRLLLFAGMGAFGIGTLLGMATAIVVGSAIIGSAFLLNTAGKLSHYRSLPIPQREKAILSGLWLALATTVLGALGTLLLSRYGSGSGAFFWPFTVGSIGFALLQMAAQGSYLPEDAQR